MGNYLVCGSPVRVSTSVLSGKPCSFSRLVLADGTIQDITSPVTVAELMLEHPLHFVCHVNSNPADGAGGDGDNGSGAARHLMDYDKPLPADTHLESGEIYYLRLKAAGFSSRSPLRSLQRCCSDKSIDAKNNVIKTANSLLHAFRVRQKGSVTQVTVSADMVAQILRKELEQERQQQKLRDGDHRNGFLSIAAGDDHNENPELQMALQMRLVSRSVSWRPKLATIQESVV